MNRELDTESIGEQLGVEGVGNVVSKVEAYCTYEEQRIELTNQPRILGLRQEGSFLLEEERNLVERLRHAPPLGDLRSRRRRAAYYWGVTIILTIAAFVFSLLAFDPFRVGWKSYLYCLGIAIVTPFLLEQFLEKWNAERILKSVAGLACAAALTSLILLAVIRGDLFAEQMKNTAPIVVIDDEQSQQPSQAPPQNNFYDATAKLLQLVMIFLALAMELGAGLALREAWRIGADHSEDWQKLRIRLEEVHQRMMVISHEITALQNEPRVFAARFWRNFYRAMLTHSVRSAMTKLLVVALAIILSHGRALAQKQTNLVIAIDLSQSVAVVGPDQKTEFQKNVDGVTKLLSHVPAHSRVTVIGITDKSFAQPDILLSATIPNDAGYFGERLKSARLQLVRAWKARSTKLTPAFRQTDILGALVLAHDIFEQQNNAKEKVLVIFSDMRQQTRELDLESLSTVPSFDRIERTRTKIGVAHLAGVHIHVLGADGAGRSILYWQTLRDLWTEYFRAGGASLETYTVLRDPTQAMGAPDSGH
jgi:hypothetical protein